MPPLNDKEIDRLLRGPPKIRSLPIHLQELKGHQPRTTTSQSDLADYSHEEVEFMMAIERYKRQQGRPYPDCREVLMVARALGWRKE